MSHELRANVEEYLRIRRALGFKLEDHRRLLSAFIDHLERIGASTPTVEAALQWATAPQGVQPFRWKQRLSVVRGFARYLHGLDPAVPVPPSDLLVYRRRRPAPYVMSDTDITRLLSAASQRPKPLTAATYHTLVGLMAVTGMRVGEAVGLDIDDVDLDSGVIVIRETKYHKARRIPVQPTTVSALRRYSQLRQQLCPRPKCNASSSPAGPAGSPPAGLGRCSPGWSTKRVCSPEPGRVPGCMTCGTVSRSRPCSTGIATAPTSPRGCRRCRPTSVTSAPHRRIGTCRPHRNCWRWPRSGSSSTRGNGHDRAGPRRRGVLHPAAGGSARRQPAHRRRLPRHAAAAVGLRPPSHR